MNDEKYNQIIKKILKDSENTLANKSKEYATEDDRMHNFELAKHLGVSSKSREGAAWNMAVKHIVSCMDILDKNGESVFDCDQLHSVEYIKEKFGDATNYLILIQAMLLERYQDGRERCQNANPNKANELLIETPEHIKE